MPARPTAPPRRDLNHGRISSPEVERSTAATTLSEPLPPMSWPASNSSFASLAALNASAKRVRESIRTINVLAGLGAAGRLGDGIAGMPGLAGGDDLRPRAPHASSRRVPPGTGRRAGRSDRGRSRPPERSAATSRSSAGAASRPSRRRRSFRAPVAGSSRSLDADVLAAPGAPPSAAAATFGARRPLGRCRARLRCLLGSDCGSAPAPEAGFSRCAPLATLACGIALCNASWRQGPLCSAVALAPLCSEPSLPRAPDAGNRRASAAASEHRRRLSRSTSSALVSIR